jgi:phosphatidate cytidylyltransferase
MSESLTRALSGLVYITLLIFATLFSRDTFLLLFGLFMLQTVNEFSQLVILPRIPALIISLFLYIVFCYFFSQNNYTDIGLIAASLFVAIRLIFWLFNNNSDNSDSISKWVNLIGYIVLPFVFIAKIPMINQVFVPSIIISIFILIWTNDTFAYIVGKSIGKKKLFEAISPKKTIEGFIGGVVFAIIASIIIAKYYVEMPIFIWVITALIVGCFGTIGDLVESKFKRVANVKDSGNIMPGHGGMLDRLDSVIFVAPFLFLLYKIINYVS